MNIRSLRHVGLAACFGILSCTPSTNVPGSNLYIEADDGKYHGPMETMRLELSAPMVEVAESITVRATGIFEDGTAVDVGSYVYWGLEGDGVQLGDKAGTAITLNGMAVGTPKITAQVGSIVGTTDVTVIPASLREIALQGATELARGSTTPLVVNGTFGDGSTMVLNEMATVTVSDESLATVIDNTTIYGTGIGTVTITVTIEEFTATHTVNVFCAYPEDASNRIAVGETFPMTTWSNAVYPDGSQGPLNLEEVYCGDNTKFDGVETLFFQVSAEWCGPCRSFRNYFNSNRGIFDNNKSQFIVTEIRDLQNVDVVTSVAASESVTRELGDDWGVRLGDAETTPTRNLFNNRAQISVFPTFYVVRKSDMKVIAWSDEDPGVFVNDYLLDVLQNYNWDWSDLDNPIEQFVSNCEPGTEESYEPNDTAPLAKEVGVAQIDGGICTDAPDFYFVNLPGSWRITLVTEPEVADIDVYAWDDAANEPVKNGNYTVGAFASSGIDDFTHSGPTLIKVQGKRSSESGPYTLYIEEL
ncbi:MAG: hypothetical protein RIT81_41435 [Deltaproteobacteria bacterium]